MFFCNRYVNYIGLFIWNRIAVSRYQIKFKDASEETGQDSLSLQYFRNDRKRHTNVNIIAKMKFILNYLFSGSPRIKNPRRLKY